jgi:hypothetical protein
MVDRFHVAPPIKQRCSREDYPEFSGLAFLYFPNEVTKFRERLINQIENHTHSLIVDAKIFLEIADVSSSRNVAISEKLISVRDLRHA